MACTSVRVPSLTPPDLRESRVQWLGSVPAHWTVSQLGFRYRVDLGKMLDSNRITGDHLAPYLRNTDVQWDRINTVDLPEMDFEPGTRDRFQLRRGDLLVCEGGEVGRAAIWTGALAECFYQKALHRLRPLSEADVPRFMYYALYAVAHRGVFAAESNPNTIDHLTAEKLRKHRFAFPPPEEQRAIVELLDGQTARIDTLAAKKERLIALLEEKRAALINRAVTKGLDPNVAMKDSGIPWLGTIPRHWSTKRLRHIASGLGVGVVVNPSQYVTDDGVPFLYGSDISESGIAVESARKISREDSERLPASVLKAGDLVTVRVGAPGVTAVVPPELEGANCASVLVIRKSTQFDSRFLCYQMNSRVGRSQVEAVQYGAAQEQFNVSHAVNFWFVLPPVGEQAKIASALSHWVSKLEAAIAKIRDQIAKLQEYRTALISAAVTGQIDVSEPATA